jgi:hypothetical protein
VECFACGLPVRVRYYNRGIQRICFDCIEQNYTNGEEFNRQLEYKRAGVAYKIIRLKQ